MTAYTYTDEWETFVRQWESDEAALQFARATECTIAITSKGAFSEGREQLPEEIAKALLAYCEAETLARRLGDHVWSALYDYRRAKERREAQEEEQAEDCEILEAAMNGWRLRH